MFNKSVVIVIVTQLNIYRQIENYFRNELHSKLEQTNKQGLNVRQALESYTMIGSEFDDLVREYTYLQEEIQKKEEMSRSLISSTQQADGD